MTKLLFILLFLFGCSLKKNIEKEEIVSFQHQSKHMILGSWISLNNLKDALIDKDNVGKTWGVQFDSKFVYEFEEMTLRLASSYTITQDSNYMYIQLHDEPIAFKVIFLTPDIIELEIYDQEREESIQKDRLVRIVDFPKNDRELHEIAKKNKRRLQ